MKSSQLACRNSPLAAYVNAMYYGRFRYIFFHILLVLSFLLFWNTVGKASEPQEFLESKSSTSKNNLTFQAFWKVFRETALNSPEKLHELSRLPVRMHGPLDSDPQKLCDAKALVRVWPIVLAGSVFDTNIKGELIKVTVADFLQQHPVLSDKMVRMAGENRLRVGDFEFVRHGIKWHLALVYTDTEDIKCPVTY